MGIAYNPGVVSDGLSLCLDAANIKSYPGSGNTWFDLSGNANHCTLFNSPAFTSELNGGLTFNGTNYGIMSPKNMNLDANFTISVLFKPFSNLTGVTDSRHSLFSGSICGDYGLEIGAFNGCETSSTNDGRRFLMHRQCNCFSNMSTAFAYEVNQFALFTFTRSSSRVGIMYLNGNTISSTFDATYAYTQPSQVYIARRGTNQGQSFSGTIYSIYAYNKALSSQEVKQNFNALRGKIGL